MIDELVRKNRSYRGYDERRRVTREELLQMVDCARLTPSSVNVQPLKYFLAYEEAEVRRIQPLTKWARALQPMQLPHPGHCPTAFVVICQDLSISDSLPRFQKDVGIAAQTLLLKAAEMGLGGCMIGNFSGGEVRRALNLPESIAPVLVIAIGKPDETVVLTEVGADGRTDYYRDGSDVHHVPKRRLEDVVLN